MLVDTLENVVFNLLPSPCIAAIAATAISAAIKPYSIAVAPRLLRMRFRKRSDIDTSNADITIPRRLIFRERISLDDNRSTRARSSRSQSAIGAAGCHPGHYLGTGGPASTLLRRSGCAALVQSGVRGSAVN